MKIGDLKYKDFKKKITGEDYKVIDAVLNTYYYYDGYAKIKLFQFHKDYEYMKLFDLFKNVNLGSYEMAIKEILNKEIDK